VRVDGRLDQGPALALGRLIDDQLLAGPPVFMLNLSGVSALDRDSASALVAAADRASGLNVKVCVVASNGVAGALRAAAGPQRLALHGTVAEALAAGNKD
jgi:anti-anti-sigma regulatory factor